MLTDWLSALEGVASTVALIVLIWQMRILMRQLRFNAVLYIDDVNRDLIGRALDDPDLRAILDGKTIQDPKKERRYFQLWINQIKLIHLGWQSSFLPRSSWQGFQRDIGDFAKLPQFQQHWSTMAPYYSDELRAFMEQCTESNKSPSDRP